MKKDSDKTTTPDPTQSIITITTTKKKWKEEWSLRARIGIRILQILQVVKIEWE